MTKLEYTLMNDVLAKMLFVKYPDLLKRLVSALLHIGYDSIEQFEITNPDIPPDAFGDKFCRLDVGMVLDGQKIDIELQVANEGDYPERSLYYWAREYSSALEEGGEYAGLPRTIVISIIAFKLFGCDEYHSEFQPLEVTRHTPLTDKQVLHYFELPKLPQKVSADDELKLWLKLFGAQTEEELKQIEEMGVPVMEQAVGAYRHVSATDEFKEIERLRSRARHNEASALGHARREAVRESDKKWQSVVADKDAALADKDAALADKDAALADKDAEISKLRALLEGK
ncbi:MAG: Rpn family recombination-promoting nuclease/putative transposase [Clostridiales bacterium]|nr:Rpn family recombination-promoting nuclease/putative transposase [Clostridiales bacterium]